VRINLNDLKNGDFDISDKERSAAVKTNCEKMGKSRRKRWKILWLIIILYC